MDIQVSNNNGQPIYEQIFQQIKHKLYPVFWQKGQLYRRCVY